MSAVDRATGDSCRGCPLVGRIARDIHEGPLQALVAVLIELDLLGRALGPTHGPVLAALVGRARSSVVQLQDLTADHEVPLVAAADLTWASRP